MLDKAIHLKFCKKLSARNTAKYYDRVLAIHLDLKKWLETFFLLPSYSYFCKVSAHLRKFLAVFLLLLFLFPTVIKFVHDYTHKDDVHCTQTGLHFHKTEHHCAIDDFVPFTFDTPTLQQFIVFIPKIHLEYLSFYIAPHISETYKCHFSLRGPPKVG